MSEAKVDKIQLKMKDLLAGILNFELASNVNARRAQIIKFTTGVREIDNMLCGGIETGTITEIFGASNLGKLSHVFPVTTTIIGIE